MQTKICPKCGAIRPHEDRVCECGFDFVADQQHGEEGDLEDAIDVLQSFARAGGSRLNVTAFAATAALFWGLGLFMITWWIIFFDGPSSDATMLGRVYRGYEISATGSFIGLAWGLTDGLVGGAVFAWAYNTLAALLTLRSRKSAGPG